MKNQVTVFGTSAVAGAVAMLLGATRSSAIDAVTQNSDNSGGSSNSATQDASTHQSTSQATLQATLNPVIVTGTRVVGVTAYQSSTPIQVISGAEMKATGATTVFDALKALVPSFSASAEGIDTDNIFRAARLRGMNPGETLVLVNGKRVNNSAIMIYYQTPNAPSDPVDLDMIPTSLVDHVEVLTDGASALYGSDAVAGVVNIILKNSPSDGYVTSQAGETSRGDGFKWTTSAAKGFELGENGYVDVSFDHTHQDFVNRGGIDVLTVGEKNVYGVANGPVYDENFGGPSLGLTTGGFNLAKPLSANVTLYAFGNIGYRTAAYRDNDRPDSVAPTIFPDGFTPQQTLRETDEYLTAGIKGDQYGWDWDLSASYGSDHSYIAVINTVNLGLYQLSLQPGGPPYPPGLSGTQGSLGDYYLSMRNVEASVRRSFNIGMAGPIDLAAGIAYRHENYGIGQGAPLTYELGGTQGEAGFSPVDAAAHSRNVKSVYVDAATHIARRWRIEAAGRHEDYSEAGIGSTTTGMLTTRFEFTPRLAIRGSISSAFHAPTLAEEYFSATAVQPTAFALQAPPTSPGAVALGALPLRPETANDVDLGVVAEPVRSLRLTADVYQIQLDHRVIDSALIGGPYALQAAMENDPNFQAASGVAGYFAFFNNAINTRTRGLDFSASYITDQSDRGLGLFRYLLTANLNHTEITSVAPVPARTAAALTAAGQPLSYLNGEVTTDVTTASPSSKIVFLVNWMFHKWDVNLVETHYGSTMETSRVTSSICSCAYPYRIAPAFVTDVDVGYNLTDRVKVDVGGTNIFDRMPVAPPIAAQASRQAETVPQYTPWGVLGADFYGRITLNF